MNASAPKKRILILGGANLDGSNRRTVLFAQGNLTGIAYVERT
jgi:hypothetical protein